MFDPNVIGLKAYILSVVAGKSLEIEATSLAASPLDMVEGILIAAEILTSAQITLGFMNVDEISAIKSRVTEYVSKLSKELEDSGKAAALRARFANVLQNKPKSGSN